MYLKKAPDLPDEYLREIGRIVMLWGELEDLLHFALVAALLGTFKRDGRADAVFIHMAFPQKLDALSSMLKIHDDKPHGIAKYYLDRAQPRLKEAQEKRNAIVHQYWTYNGTNIIRSSRKARGTLQFWKHEVQLSELHEISLTIQQAMSALYVVVKRLTPKKAEQVGQ